MRTTRIMVPVFALALGLSGLAACGDDDGGAECGDGVLEGTEECDGIEFEDDCDTMGYYTGDVTCNADCTINFSGCSDCGDGVLDADEECDDTEFGTNTCITENFTGGDLACTASCTLDTAGCTDSSCAVIDLTSLDPICSTDGTDWEFFDILSAGGDTYAIEINLWQEYLTSGSFTTGAKTLGTGVDHNWEDCAHCVSAYLCSDSSCSAVDGEYFATAGTLNLTTLGDVGGSFAGSLSNVEFTEWDYDNDIAVTSGDCFQVTEDFTVTTEAF